MGHWETTQVASHAVEWFTPDKVHPQGWTVLYLHGAFPAPLQAQAGLTRALEKHGLRLAAPRSGNSWWGDRIWPEFDAQLTPWQFVSGPVLQAIEERWQTKPPRVALLGVSMGGQAALRAGFMQASRFPVVAALAPAIDFQRRWELYPALQAMYEDPEAARQDTALLHVHPLAPPPHIWFGCDPDDRWFESADRLQMKLAAIGVRHTCDLTTRAGGHTWNYYNHQMETACDFLVAGLEERARTLTIVSDL